MRNRHSPMPDPLLHDGTEVLLELGRFARRQGLLHRLCHRRHERVGGHIQERRPRHGFCRCLDVGSQLQMNFGKARFAGQGDQVSLVKPDLAQLVRIAVVVDLAEGPVKVGGQGVGCGDGVVVGLDLDRAVAGGFDPTWRY
jgi:hypothetical protein